MKTFIWKVRVTILYRLRFYSSNLGQNDNEGDMIKKMFMMIFILFGVSLLSLSCVSATGVNTTVAPYVTAVDPSNNAVNVAADKVITVTFSKSIKAGTKWVELRSSNGSVMPVTQSINGTVLTITPSNPLTKGTKYALILHTGSVTDLTGNNIAYYGTNFVTDGTAPVVKSVDPVNKAVNVATDKVITVKFSEAIKAGTNWIELKSSNGTVLSTTPSINGNVLTITPNNPLTKATKYSLILHTGSVTDLSCNNAGYYGINFVTDGTAPVVKSVDPVNKAVKVALGKVITVKFSEAIKEGTNWVELKSSNGTVLSTTPSINGNVLTITPNNPLTKGTKYSLILHTGSVTDLAGNNLAYYGTSFVTDTMEFTSNQILDASAKVKAYVESNQRLPDYVTIGTTNVSMAQFLQMMSVDLLQISSGKTGLISLPNVSAPSNSTDSVKQGNIYKAEYLSLAQSIKNTLGTAPNYISSSLGNIRFESSVYMYSKVLNYYKSNGVLPNYVAIKPWLMVTNPEYMPVYITSDNIINKSADTDRVNQIVDGLAALGVYAVNWGLGPNTHIAVLQSVQVPQNALVIDIYGGACAGTIYEMGTSWYKRIKGTRDVFTVFWPTATNITGLAWLPRAHDDDFSADNFTGLEHPNQYMLSNGYRYIYSGDIDAIINSIFNESAI